LDDARRLVADYVRHYNEVRLHSAIGYITPADKLAGRDVLIFAERDRKLAARERRSIARDGPASHLIRMVLASVLARRYDKNGLGGGWGDATTRRERRPRDQDRRGRHDAALSFSPRLV
jgi:hypothetical protein